MNPEIHLPEHMRLQPLARFIRFLFYPLSLICAIMYFNDYSQFARIEQLCHQRHACHSYCIIDGFPDNLCHDTEINIEYNGNKYKHFFQYIDPYGAGYFVNKGESLTVYMEKPLGSV
jgi:hypothetical protein